MSILKRFAIPIAAILFLISAAGGVLAQGAPYPGKPVRMLVGFAAGGPSDVQARLLAKEMSPSLGQSVIVENRTGAAGIVAFDALLTSPPDGYTTLLLSNTTTTALQAQKRPLEPARQFIPIGGTHVTPVLLLVNPVKIDVHNLPELFGYLKSHPGTDFTSSGPGSPGHISMIFMARQRDLEMTHIPYRGVGPALLDVMAGRVSIILVDSATAKTALANGLRAIASVASVRSPVAPNVPTSAEQGVQNFTNDSFAGLVAPAKTPQAAVDQLAAALNRAVTSDAFSGHQRTSGSQAKFTDGRTFSEAIQRDYERWGKAIQETGIKVD